MKFKVAVVIVLLLAIFPSIATGVAQEFVHAVLQALGSLVGASSG
jgi:hypothetical protein